MMEKKARLAFVGLGKYAHNLAKNAERCDRIEIKTCFTRTPEKRRQFASAFGCSEKESFEAICADPDIDGVILVTPNDVHSEQAVALAKAGKHVFVEKPICNTLEQADAMIRACKEANVILAVGHQERRCPVYREWKRMIDVGAFGKVFSFESNHCGNLLKAWPKDDWRFQADRGASHILHKGIHKIDVLNYLFGEMESVATLSRPLDFSPQVSESIVSAFRFANGVLGSFTSSFAYTNCTMNIYGEKVSVFYSGYGSKFTMKIEETWEFRTVDCRPVHEVHEELSEFADAILGQGRVEVTGEAGRQAIAAALAAQQAYRCGSTVNMSDFRQK